MDLETALNEHTIDKDYVYDGWIRRACSESEALEEVMEKAFGGNERERKRANWILHHVSDRNQEVHPLFASDGGPIKSNENGC
jgi:hypothetical protein